MQLQVNKKSNSINKTQQPDAQYHCAYCGRVFMRESTINTHACEQKRRHLERDRPGNRIAYVSYARFYKFNTSSKPKTHADFITSTYYLAFVRFGNYCVDARVLSVERYVDWLLQNKIRIDEWASDTVYKRYLLEFLRHESPLDAVARSIETLVELSSDGVGSSADYLRWGNSNRVCHHITTGYISPWLLYQCNSGVEFLNALNADQLRIVYDYVNPELWALQFTRNPDRVAEVKELLRHGGF